MKIGIAYKGKIERNGSCSHIRQKVELKQCKKLDLVAHNCNPVLNSLRQEDYCKSEVSSKTVSFRIVWVIE